MFIIFDSQDHSLATMNSLNLILKTAKKLYKDRLLKRENNLKSDLEKRELENIKTGAFCVMPRQVNFFCCCFLESQSFKSVKRILGIKKMKVVMQQNLILDLNLNPNKR